MSPQGVHYHSDPITDITTATNATPDLVNSVKNDKKKKSILPKLFSRKNGKGNADGNLDKSDAVEVTNEFETKAALRRKAFTEVAPVMRKSFSERQRNPRLEGLNLSSLEFSMGPATEIKEVRMFVATWNVGGKTPNNSLNLEDFLQVEGSTDIYVLGFQEIVPLSAGNVLVVEDNEPAAKWLILINQALNRPYSHESCETSNPSGSRNSTTPTTSSSLNFFQKPSLKVVSRNFRANTGLLKSCNCNVVDSLAEMERRRRPRKSSDNLNRAETFSSATTRGGSGGGSGGSGGEESPSDLEVSCSPCSPSNDTLRYRLIASKQMVGIFLTVWARSELVQHIGHLRASSVGRGIMGKLGNKGCISISMSLHQTSFCFVCSHLASGEKEGDELRRNSDVAEILKSTQFSKICKNSYRKDPGRIMDHDRVIWMGDLNYRVSLSYDETKNLLEDNDWDALLEKDQLNVEREAGRVFNGYKEGRILFAPTYKYSQNSDSYAGETGKSKKKRRTPAWCDRILWRGSGIEQLAYSRGESRFSDHRPVFSIFAVEADAKTQKTKFRKGFSCALGTRSRSGYDDCFPQRHSFYEC